MTTFCWPDCNFSFCEGVPILSECTNSRIGPQSTFKAIQASGGIGRYVRRDKLVKITRFNLWKGAPAFHGQIFCNNYRNDRRETKSRSLLESSYDCRDR